MKRVLLTGASGYIGSNLMKHLVEIGMDVNIVVRKTSNLKFIDNTLGNIETHVYDGEINTMYNIIDKSRPNIIFHLASLFISEHNSGDIDNLIKSNILFGTQLLEAATHFEVRNFINTGTHWQNYNTKEYCPSNLYAATKQAFIDIAGYYVSKFGLRFITLKLVDTYGPFDPRRKLLYHLKNVADTGGSLHMSPGEQKLGMLYIDDAIKALMLCSSRIEQMLCATEQSFIALPEKTYTLKEIVNIFESVYEKKLNVVFGARDYKNREVMDVFCGDNNILSNIDTIDLKEGLQRVLETENKKCLEIK